jgi:hypothetical protein
MRLATQLLRSLSALPLMMVAVAALVVGNPPAPHPDRLDDLAALPVIDCAPAAPAGLRGLARMPGDLGQLGRRISCAG